MVNLKLNKPLKTRSARVEARIRGVAPGQYILLLTVVNAEGIKSHPTQVVFNLRGRNTRGITDE